MTYANKNNYPSPPAKRSLESELAIIASQSQHFSDLLEIDPDTQVPNAALTTLYASAALDDIGVRHNIHAGLAAWRINSGEDGVIEMPTLWININGLIFDPSIGPLIDQQRAPQTQKQWRPDYIMIHQDDTYSPDEVHRYATGTLCYNADKYASKQADSAFESIKDKLPYPDYPDQTSNKIKSCSSAASAFLRLWLERLPRKLNFQPAYAPAVNRPSLTL